jgi:hypothetical protein
LLMLNEPSILLPPTNKTSCSAHWIAAFVSRQRRVWLG